jgi:oxygen-dependent protoporphyrinogen oxidase
MPRTVVVGGGLAGLAAALARSRGGIETLLLEAASEPGGVVRSVRRDGYLLELGPNTVRPTPELLALIQDLGLTSEALFSDPRLPRYVDFEGRLLPLPTSPAALLTTHLLSLSGKLRLAGEPLRRGAVPERESVRDFFARRLGPEVADRMVTPFVSGIFAGDAARLSAEDAFPAPVRWERESGSLLVGALREARSERPRGNSVRGLLSFRDGLGALPRAAARALADGFRKGASVDTVEPAGRRWRVAVGSGQFEADELVLAVPAPAAARLVRRFAPEAADALDAIPHSPLAVLHVAWPDTALPRPLRGFGHLVVPDASRRILGGVWSSSLFPGRAPAGHALLTVFLGGARDPEAPSLADGVLVDLATRDLERQGLVRGQPVFAMATRYERAIPQYTHGHAARIAAVSRAEAAWPGLRFLGNYRGGISVGDVVRNALAV